MAHITPPDSDFMNFKRNYGNENELIVQLFC